MRAPPESTLSHHDVEDSEQAHARHQSHLLELSSSHEPLVKRLDSMIGVSDDQGSRVERYSDPPSADLRFSCGLHPKWDQGEYVLSCPYQPIVVKTKTQGDAHGNRAY